MSDTPRTDALRDKYAGDPSCGDFRDELENLARELEDELAEVGKDYRCLAELLDGHDATECRANLVKLKQELATERALADRLAEALRDIEGRASDESILLHPDADAKGCVDDCWEWSEQALAAWKAARDEASH